MKVELIAETFSFEFKDKINDFIKDKQIIDIKFTTNATTTKYALIMYEERNKE